MKKMDISKVLKLSSKKKFEAACATFDIVDHILKIEVPSFLKGRKLAVQAINLLADKQLKYGFQEPPKEPVVDDTQPSKEPEANSKS